MRTLISFSLLLFVQFFFSSCKRDSPISQASNCHIKTMTDGIDSIVITYDTQNRISMVHFTAAPDEDWTVRYTGNQKIAESISTHPLIYFKVINTYDNNQRHIKMSYYFNYSDSTKQDVSTMEYSGNELTRTTFNEYGQAPVILTHTWQGGNLVRTEGNGYYVVNHFDLNRNQQEGDNQWLGASLFMEVTEVYNRNLLVGYEIFQVGNPIALDASSFNYEFDNSGKIINVLENGSYGYSFEWQCH